MTIGPLAAEAASLDVQHPFAGIPPEDFPRASWGAERVARWYLARGVIVFPVCAPTPDGKCTAAASGWKVHKAEHKYGKRPVGDWGGAGKLIAPMEPDIIKRWRGEKHNVGLPCGRNGDGYTVALDFDGPEGERTRENAELILGALPATLTSATGRGRHMLFAAPPEATADDIATVKGSVACVRLDATRRVLVSATKEEPSAFDLRADGGYIVAPGSMHASGAEYTAGGVSIAALPASWWDALPRKGQRPGPKRAELAPIPGEGAARGRIAAVANPPDPRSPATAKRYAATLAAALPDLLADIRACVDTADSPTNDTIRDNGLRALRLAVGANDLDAVHEAVLSAALDTGHPPAAVRATLASVRAAAEEQGPPELRDRPPPDRRTSAAGRRSTDGAARGESEAAGQGGEVAALLAAAGEARDALKCTDVGNAERLARRHGNDLRWCEAWGSWLVWSGRQWERDDTGETVRRAVDTVRQIGVEAARCDDEGRRKALWHHALKSESARSIGSMVTLARAQSGLAARPDDLDANPWLLNCRNGIVDLRTGELMPHDRDAMCTKLAPVDYDPSARSDAWDAFLRSALDGDTRDGAEVIEYVRRAVGYSLTGDTSEEVLFFVYGPGGSGKSTFLEAVRAVLGDYATTARFDMFLKREGDAPSANPDEARLRGSRFVASIETDEGKRLSPGTIKRLTGGDIISARELYSRAFDYKPAFKLWLAANDAPRVNDQDDALFRRMRRIVFPHGRTGEGTRDKSIKATLTNASVTGPAILAWAVQGCLAWQRDGLKTPAAVVASTNAYRAENDPLAEFFAARVAFDARATVARKSIRAAYEVWVRDCDSGNPMSPKRFAERLRARLVAEHGAAHKADASVRLGQSVVDGWRGMRLSDPHAAEDTAAPARRHEPDDAPDDAPSDGLVA